MCSRGLFLHLLREAMKGVFYFFYALLIEVMYPADRAIFCGEFELPLSLTPNTISGLHD